MSVRESDSLKSRMEVSSSVAPYVECQNCGADFYPSERSHFRDCDHIGCLIQICPMCSANNATASCDWPGCGRLNLCRTHYVTVDDWTVCWEHLEPASIRIVWLLSNFDDAARRLREFFGGKKA